MLFSKMLCLSILSCKLDFHSQTEHITKSKATKWPQRFQVRRGLSQCNESLSKAVESFVT
jgi:hypothetical protein